MIVAYSRPIALKIYRKILEFRPSWKEKIAVVMTSDNNDPEDWRKIIGNKNYKDELARKFKDNNDPLKITIVVDMWLTGFDVLSLATMCVYKPMSGHNLMQAIARVNRVFRNKEGGLVVDYVGIASALKQAMNDYTIRDKKNYGDTDVSKVAYPKFLEKLDICRDLLHGFDYSNFATGSNLDRAKTISGAVNFIIDREKEQQKDTFIKEDPFDALQETIDSKNKKIDNYLKNCDRCFLLVYVPDVSKGNYCHFTNLLKKHLFSSKFENIFLSQWNRCFKDENFVYTLKCSN